MPKTPIISNNWRSATSEARSFHGSKASSMSRKYFFPFAVKRGEQMRQRMLSATMPMKIRNPTLEWPFPQAMSNL